MKKVMLSGIQPTGSLHIGNYLGAIKNWVSMTEDYYGYFCIVDYHAITIEYDPKEFQKKIFDAATEYLACGLDPDKCSIFIQSHVRAHVELAWIFNSIVPVSELERMTQYKDKSKSNETNINAGLLTYPALMAADILLYKPHYVPVGEDQTQHIELTRMIARKFNNRYGECFLEPEVAYSKVPKILGLDGKSKMSKSLNNHIPLNLSDKETETLILTKAITDENRKRKSDPGNPLICNVYSWHKIFSPQKDQEECFESCQNASIGCVDCKKILVRNMNSELTPIRESISKLNNNRSYVEDILNKGAKEASLLAESTLKEAKDLMGII